MLRGSVVLMGTTEGELAGSPARGPLSMNCREPCPRILTDGAGCELTCVNSVLPGRSSPVTRGRNPGPRLSGPFRSGPQLPYSKPMGMCSTHRIRALPPVLIRTPAPVSSSRCHYLVVVASLTFALKVLIVRRYCLSNCQACPIVQQINSTP